jgi:hypothetical protein
VLVSVWFPIHFLTAGLTWGLREIIDAMGSRDTATPRASGTPTDPAETENLSKAEDTEADTPTATTGVTEADTDKQ